MSEERGEIKVCNYWEFERVTAWSFNRLKGKIYNLIEASVDDEKQQKALKGLVKGFANDEYKLCVKEMRYNARGTSLLPIGEDTDVPEAAEPLENRGGVFGGE